VNGAGEIRADGGLKCMFRFVLGWVEQYAVFYVLEGRDCR
jgi:hypothetical protein